MARTATASDFAIPVDSIQRLRDCFPGISLIFEIDLAVDDCWDGLEHLAGEFRRAGARLRLLRATQSGVISCTVVDGGSDLGQLAARFGQGQGVSISGWTTRIQYE